jgi:hypothetical protein
MRQRPKHLGCVHGADSRLPSLDVIPVKAGIQQPLRFVIAKAGITDCPVLPARSRLATPAQRSWGCFASAKAGKGKPGK